MRGEWFFFRRKRIGGEEGSGKERIYIGGTSGGREEELMSLGS